jgi:HTH-type transcriptional regulator / antitoxin HipB
MNATIVRIPDQLGSLLREARLRQSLTQADVAKRLGVSVQAVSRLENNAGRASFDRVHRLCLMLGLDLLLRQKDIEKTPKLTQSEW